MNKRFTKEDVIRRFEDAMREGEPQGKPEMRDFSQVAQRIKELTKRNKNATIS